MSNQFVEIKSTVFKKFDKENLFQITCADVVERFQLALMLVIIVARNFIETGGPAPPGGDLLPFGGDFVPGWLAQLLGPFVLVLGTETVIDWIKHAYITKFNNTRPAVFGRFLDVLARDYAAHAFADPDLTRRLGLPVLPLASLFVRAGVQTWQMLLAARLPPPLPATPPYAPAHPAVELLRVLVPSARTVVTLVFCALLFATLLVAKLLLGMALLSYARARCERMDASRRPSPAGGPGAAAKPTAAENGDEGLVVEGAKRVGAWGIVEVGEESRRWIVDGGDGDGKEAAEKSDVGKVARPKGLEGVERYKMVAKRIW